MRRRRARRSRRVSARCGGNCSGSSGVHDDVFELGAMSFQVFALLARLQPLFGDAVTPELLMEAPTVAELAARLEAAISPRA